MFVLHFRTFSKGRVGRVSIQQTWERVKTIQRASVNQQRLNFLALLTVERFTSTAELYKTPQMNSQTRKQGKSKLKLFSLIVFL